MKGRALRLLPKKEQILELAKERWRYDQIRFGNPKLAEIEPEYEELLESGYIAMARNELMYSEKRKYAKWLESEDSELETVYEIPFNVEEALKTGFCILGNKGSGKTNLAKHLVRKLIENGIIVYVLDSSKAWIKKPTPIADYFTVLPYGTQRFQWEPKPYVFDLSLLPIPLKIKFVNLFCKTLLNAHIQGFNQWELVLFEEAHLIFPNGSLRRLKRYAEAVTFATVGRNYKLSFGFITQFPANVDKLLVKLTVQRYFFQTWEPNDYRYMQRLLGKHAKELKSLEVGECIYQAKGEIKKVVFPEYGA